MKQGPIETRIVYNDDHGAAHRNVLVFNRRTARRGLRESIAQMMQRLASGNVMRARPVHVFKARWRKLQEHAYELQRDRANLTAKAAA